MKNNLKGNIERILERGNVFPFLSFSQRNLGILKTVVIDVLAIVKQYPIPTYFLALTFVVLK